jgi:hypothetical protein
MQEPASEKPAVDRADACPSHSKGINVQDTQFWALCSNDRDMGSGGAREVSGEAGVVRDFDGTFVRNEAKLQVEGQRTGMVRGTGVQPDAVRFVLPCQRKAVLQKRASGTFADERGGYAKKRQLNVREATAIELQQAVVFAGVGQGEDIDRRVVKYGLEFVVGHAQAAEPQPRLANDMIEFAIPAEIRLRDTAHGEV